MTRNGDGGVFLEMTNMNGSSGGTLIHEDSSDCHDGPSRDERAVPRHDADSTVYRLGTIPLAVIVFYSVSGGPFGVEPAVRSAGFFYCLLGFAIVPFIWSVPEALVTTELGSAFPEAAGGVAWVEKAYGKGLGALTGYLGWVSGATDNAIYPVLFLEYLVQVINDGSSSDNGDTGGGEEEDDDVLNLHGFSRFAILALVSMILGYINYRGLQIVGTMSIVICILSMSPFVIMGIVGASKIDSRRWFQLPDPAVAANEQDSFAESSWLPMATFGGVLWRPFLNNLFWNLNSFDSAACFAGEVHNVGTVFPRAMGLAVVFVAAGYLLPLMVAIGASDSEQTDWVDGYFAAVMSQIAGPWLSDWTVFAAGISNLALFQAELSSDAFQILGLAERGFLPRIFAKRSRYGTPTYGLLLGTAVIVLMCVADLGHLVEMLNFNYAVSLLIEYMAFIKLRICHPDVPRPFRIPLNTTGCIVMLIPAILMTLLVLALASFATYVFSFVVILLAVAVHYGAQLARRKEWCSFVDVDEDGVGSCGDEELTSVTSQFRDDHDDNDHDDNLVNGDAPLVGMDVGISRRNNLV